MAADAAISAIAEGVNEIVDRIVVLTKINVRYAIRVPAGSASRQDRPGAGEPRLQVPRPPAASRTRSRSPGRRRSSRIAAPKSSHRAGPGAGEAATAYLSREISDQPGLAECLPTPGTRRAAGSVLMRVVSTSRFVFASRFVVAIFALFLGAAPALDAQQSGRGSRDDLTDQALVSSIAARSIGPAVMSGRVVDIAVAHVAESDEQPRAGTVIYIAAATGGVWKSTSGGVTWEPVLDDAGVGSMGDVTVAPSNPSVVWAGSGEPNNMRSSSYGDGVYKSEDGGGSFRHMGLRESQHIGRIVVHPSSDEQTVYVAAVGPLWAAGGQRGVYKTTDGGETWEGRSDDRPAHGRHGSGHAPPRPPKSCTLQRCKGNGGRTATSEAAREAASTRRRTAAQRGSGWRRGCRTPRWAGSAWTSAGRIRTPCTRSSRARKRACTGPTTAAPLGGRPATSRRSRGTSARSASIPTDPDVVYHLGVPLQRSIDGGETWERIARSVHVDHHAMWINPNNPHHLMLGNDGGFYMSHDRGETWDFSPNLPISQFYAVGVDMQEPFFGIYGGLQDNSTWGGPSRTRNAMGIGNADWYRMAGGDGFFAAVDPRDHNVAYVESQNGNLVRFNGNTGERKSIRPRPAPGDDDYRFNWSAPIQISPHDPSHGLLCGQPCLQEHGPGQLVGGAGRGPDARDRPGQLADDGLDPQRRRRFSSPRHRGLFQHLHDASVVVASRPDRDRLRRRRHCRHHRRRRDVDQADRLSGRARHDLRQQGPLVRNRRIDVVRDLRRPPKQRFSTLCAEEHGPGRQLELDRRRLAGVRQRASLRRAPRTIRTCSSSARRLGPSSPWTAGSRGLGWRTGFPPSPVHDIKVHARDNALVVATHGRGFFVVDDLTPLLEMAAAKAADGPYVFSVRDALAYVVNTAPTTGTPRRPGLRRGQPALRRTRVVHDARGHAGAT